MSTLKIVEFASQENTVFGSFLKFLSGQQNWNWQFETIHGFSKEALNGADVAVVDTALSHEIMPQLQLHSTETRSSDALDSFFKEGGKWYPRLLLYEAMRLVLVKESRDLNNRAPAFVIGDNELARVAASVLAEVGMSDIYLVAPTETVGDFRDKMMRSHLGLRFHVVVPEDLTVQAVSAGIIINTVDLSTQEELFRDLTYFNFMRADGYVMDLNLVPAHNLLLGEAVKADLKTLTPQTVYANLTRLWLDRLEVGSYLLIEDLHEIWMQFLKENSSSV